MKTDQWTKFNDLYFKSNELKLELEALVNSGKVGKLEMRDVRHLNSLACEVKELSSSLYFCVKEE